MVLTPTAKHSSIFRTNHPFRWEYGQNSGNSETTIQKTPSPFPNTENLDTQMKHFNQTTSMNAKNKREKSKGQQMPSPRPWKMIRYFHSTVRP